MTQPVKLSDLLGQTPAPIQLQLLQSDAFEIGMVTGFAAGKTRAICADSLALGTKYPNGKILIGRKTFQEMRDTVKQPWFQMADVMHRAGWFVKPKNWDYREGTNHAQLINGTQYFFSNFDDPLKFRNEEYSAVYIDQTEENTEDLWELILGRIRHALVPAHSWKAVAAANDNGRNWMWRRFVYDLQKQTEDPRHCQINPYCMFKDGHPDEDGALRTTLPCSTRRFFHGTTLDNKHNLSKTYLANLLSKPKEWQRHFIYATMEGGAGRLLPDPLVVPHFDPPAHWPRYRAVDHALNSPCCCLWITVNTDGHAVNGLAPGAAYVYREYWEGHSSVDQHVERILKATGRENVLMTIIDKSAFRKDQSRTDGVLLSIADLYVEFGLFCIPSQGDPYPRVERIIAAHHKGLQISERCIHLVRTFPEYYADQNKSDGNYEIKNRSSFHAIDALGYGLMAIPIDPRVLNADPVGTPEYIKTPSKDADPLTIRHNRNEWSRIKRIQDSHEQGGDGLNTLAVKADEFWANDSLEEHTVGGEYDPFGGTDR